jgi:hypothetical protein
METYYIEILVTRKMFRFLQRKVRTQSDFSSGASRKRTNATPHHFTLNCHDMSKVLIFVNMRSVSGAESSLWAKHA